MKTNKVLLVNTGKIFECDEAGIANLYTMHNGLIQDIIGTVIGRIVDKTVMPIKAYSEKQLKFVTTLALVLDEIWKIMEAEENDCQSLMKHRKNLRVNVEDFHDIKWDDPNNVYTLFWKYLDMYADEEWITRYCIKDAIVISPTNVEFYSEKPENPDSDDDLL